MDKHIIQFGDLDELLSELHPDMTVRIQPVEETIATNHTVGMRTVALGVHVRAINSDNHILACFLPVKRIDLLHGKPFSETDEGYHIAWENSTALAERIKQRLHGEHLHIRAGIIDLGRANLVPAKWFTDPAKAEAQEA